MTDGSDGKDDDVPPTNRAPIRIAVTNDFELVVHGLARMLAPFAERVVVVDTAVDGDDLERHVDVALFDTFGHLSPGVDEVARLVEDPDVGEVAVFTWDFDPAVVERLRHLGCRGYLSKALPAPDLVTALEQVAAGHEVVSRNPVLDRHTDDHRDWPGRARGLSERESEVLILIAEGLANQQIAAALNISINSVKSHVRSAYRKLDVATRAQAVRRVLDLGMVRPALSA